MASLFFQLISLDDNATTYDNQSYITTISGIITEEYSINNIVSTSLNNGSSTSNNIALARPNYVNESLITRLVCPIIIIIFVIAIIGLAFLRHHQHLQTQQKKEKEYLQNEKLCAHPFEEVLIVADEPQSIELMQTRPTETTN
ncbi:unnamed protein product [Rotaria sp. Silwood1]|nr:unnamed protein product [Rotaria sp. Silwood1]